jgi:hypothetical protein
MNVLKIFVEYMSECIKEHNPLSLDDLAFIPTEII